MSALMFVLSGEHPTLPAAEALAAIRAERRACEVLEQLDQVLIAETKADPRVLASRLAMSHEICSHLCTADADDVLDAIGSTDIVDVIPHGRTFAVRVRGVKRHSEGVDAQALAKEIANLLVSEVDFKVDLTNPDVEILAVLTDGRCAVGLTEARVDREQFERRRPTARAAFHPGTLMPALARCMVNLARTPRGGTLLDPFAGVGGILIEAGLLGAKPIGVDLDQRMIEGAKLNLESFGIKDYQLMVGDARRLPPLEVDAIATDPPYGRRAGTAGVGIEELYRESMLSASSALKPKGHMCITSPAELDLERFAEEAGLKPVESHEQRVHKSLTRRIYVFKKK